MILCGWIYPHFLEASWTRYLLAAPLGTISCPTLAARIGLTIASEHHRGSAEGRVSTGTLTVAISKSGREQVSDAHGFRFLIRVRA